MNNKDPHPKVGTVFAQDFILEIIWYQPFGHFVVYLNLDSSKVDWYFVENK